VLLCVAAANRLFQPVPGATRPRYPVLPALGQYAPVAPAPGHYAPVARGGAEDGWAGADLWALPAYAPVATDAVARDEPVAMLGIIGKAIFALADGVVVVGRTAGRTAQRYPVASLAAVCVALLVSISAPYVAKVRRLKELEKMQKIEYQLEAMRDKKKKIEGDRNYRAERRAEWSAKKRKSKRGRRGRNSIKTKATR
jgi:hypothetical protein